MARDGLRAGLARGDGGQGSDRARAKSALRPAIEPLEGRRLLSGFGMPPNYPTVTFDHATYRVKVSGPGEVSVHGAGKGQFALNVAGTTSASTLVVRQIAVGPGYGHSFLPVARINISSGSIGQIQGGRAVNLVGTIRTTGPVGSIQLGSVGPAARIIAEGGLGALGVSGLLDLGPKGEVSVTGPLTGTIQAGEIDLQGGKITIGQGLGGLSVSTLVVAKGGQFLVRGDAGPIAVTQDASIGSGTFTVAGNAQGLSFGHDLAITPGGRLALGRDLIGSITVAGGASIAGGQVFVGRDLIGSISVNGDLAIVNGGNLTIGRDLTNSLSVGGNLTLGGGGLALIGRSLGAQSGGSSGLTVGGNLSTAAGGLVQVGGDLDGLRVGGTIVGQGTASIDLAVGLDLNNWAVFGGAPNLGGVTGFNVDVGKNIVGLNVLHGLFNDFITAGVLITNVTVGADGPVAVFDTEIRAGLQITNMTLSGDVKSDRPVNPLGRRTRIIAGEDRAGNFEIAGNLENFFITGSLIDSVVAASVQPYGGNGSSRIVPAPAPAPGALDYYDAPAGGRYLGVANLGLPYAAPPFNAAIDPTIHDTVLPGEINQGLAPAPSTDGKPVYPSRSTVLGGVITTAHANNSDYAGLFAAGTSGVFVGTIPLT